MSFRVTHDGAQGLIEITYMGSISGDDLRTATREAIALQKQGDVLDFLVDAGAWDLKAALVDIYQLPAQYWKEGVDTRSRIAVILPAHETTRDGARFYEDACRNRGWNVRVLPDRAAALEWLATSR